MTIAVALLLYERATLLTLTSTLEALTAADRRNPNLDERRYSVHLVSLDGGTIETWNGCSIATTPVADLQDKEIDTLVISGGMGYLSAIKDVRLIRWLTERGAQARRIVAMGGGLFLAAEAGLLKGLRVALHPVVREEFCRRYPDVVADHEALFLRNGKIVTSPGMSAAADVALELIQEDYGPRVAFDVAQFMLVFMKRNGQDRQLSSVLQSQSRSDRFEDLHSWMATNLDKPLTVEDMAHQSGMSVRNFSRAYSQAMGKTPSDFVRSLRVEAAVRALTTSGVRISRIADECGFGGEERMRRSFIAVYGVPPTAFRRQKHPDHKPERRYAFVTSDLQG